jgi:hypothetical protein
MPFQNIHLFGTGKLGIVRKIPLSSKKDTGTVLYFS